MTFLRDKESVCRGGFSWTTLTQVLNVFPLVSIASIPVAYTVTTQPLSDFILPPSRRLLKDIFTATLWNQNQHTYKKPVLFNFFVTWIFSHFLSPFLLWKGASMLLLLQEHLTPGRGKKKNLSCFMYCHSWSKWSCAVQRAKAAIPWEAPKPHRQCQELNHNPW